MSRSRAQQLSRRAAPNEYRVEARPGSARLVASCRLGLIAAGRGDAAGPSQLLAFRPNWRRSTGFSQRTTSTTLSRLRQRAPEERCLSIKPAVCGLPPDRDKAAVAWTSRSSQRVTVATGTRLGVVEAFGIARIDGSGMSGRGDRLAAKRKLEAGSIGVRELVIERERASLVRVHPPPPQWGQSHGA